MFNSGDVVRLKSGGPMMTIWKIEPNGNYMCMWFDGENKPQMQSFSEATLEGVPPRTRHMSITALD